MVDEVADLIGYDGGMEVLKMARAEDMGRVEFADEVPVWPVRGGERGLAASVEEAPADLAGRAAREHLVVRMEDVAGDARAGHDNGGRGTHPQEHEGAVVSSEGREGPMRQRRRDEMEEVSEEG